MQQHIQIGRAEILIAPEDLAGHALGAYLAATLKTPSRRHMLCGSYEVTIAPGAEPDGHNVKLTEGPWPEPPGLQLGIWPEPPNAAWSIETDRYGVRPIYYGFDGRRRAIVSTRPEIVAALIGGRLSERFFAEQMLIGHSLDDSSPFEGVHRLRPQQRLTHTEVQGFRLISNGIDGPGETEVTTDGWIHALQPVIARAFERGAALELTGGIESRLILGLGLHAGIKPPFAFTPNGGDSGDDDVDIARRICASLGIEHVTLPAEIEPAWIVHDGRSFVTRAGFAVNACAGAWLPHALERLSRRRTAEVGAGPSACGGAFRAGPMDALCRLKPAQPWWVRMRLLRRGAALAALFGRDRARRLIDETAATARRLLREGARGRRGQPFEFHLSQRVPNAAGPALAASACWYEPIQPLLHGPHVEWERRTAGRRGALAKAQRKVTTELCPSLDRIPYRVRRRAGDRPAPAGVAAALLRDDAVRGAVESLGRSMGLSRRVLGRLIEEPRGNTRELGTLIAAAWAAESMQAVAREIWAARPPMRLVA